MAKKRHHFVPKLYLRSFSSAPKRIHLHHLPSGRSVRDASLRDQCYAHRFYGKTDEVEDELAVIDGKTASVLREICDAETAPPRESEAHGVLLAFISLQLLRTPTAREQIVDTFRKVDKQVFGDREPTHNAPLQPFSPIGDADLLSLQLGHLPSLIEAIGDLSIHVATTPPSVRLITSDNPLCKYNTYCKGIKYWGSLGMACKGLQIFAPLSPELLLLLYDSAVYSVNSNSKRRLSASQVRQVNALQFAGTDQCVYFSNWEDAGRVRREARVHRPGSRDDVVQINEGSIVGRGDDSTLVHTWEQMPTLRLSLPFSRIRLEARQIPLRERVNTYRRPYS